MSYEFWPHLHTGGVTGSIPVPPTIKTPKKFNTYDIHREICKYRNNARTRTHYPDKSGQNPGSMSSVCSSVIFRYPKITSYVAVGGHDYASLLPV